MICRRTWVWVTVCTGLAASASFGAGSTTASVTDPAPFASTSLLPSEECGDGAAPCPTAAPPAAEHQGFLGPSAPALPFDLADLDGGRVSFQPAQDMTPTLLVFWSVFCPPCREEMPLFADIALRYPPPELRVIAVSLDGGSEADAVASYARAQDLPFPVALDEERSGRLVVAGLYGVSGTPSLVLIGRDGTVTWGHEGPVDALELESAIIDGLR